MNGVGERLDALIKLLSVNQLKFSKRVGVNQSFLSAIVNGRKNISRRALQKIGDTFPQVNTNWILNGKGDMFLTDIQVEVVKEMDSAYKKSKISVLNDTVLDDLVLRKMLSVNLKTLIEHWELKKNEFFPILIPGVSKQTVTNYFNGSSQVPLFALVRLEKITGVGMSDWITRSIGSGELPPEPLTSGGDDSNQLEVIKKELRSLLNRLGG